MKIKKQNKNHWKETTNEDFLCACLHKDSANFASEFHRENKDINILKVYKYFDSNVSFDDIVD